MCLPGDGPRLGLGPAVSVPRAQVPDGKSSTLLGAAPPRFWEAGALWAWRDESPSHWTDGCDVCMGTSSAGTAVRMSAVVSLGGVFPGDFHFLFYVYCYFLSLLEDDHVSSVSLKIFYFKILAKRSLTSPGPHVP